MSTIEVRCIDQSLTVTNAPVITSGSVNDDVVHFEFCSSWDGYAKTAVFYRNEYNPFRVILDAYNNATIPKEVLMDEGCFFFGVFGVKNGAVKTSEVLRYKADKGTITSKGSIPDPTPDIYAQILSTMNSLGQVVNYITDAEIDEILRS